MHDAHQGRRRQKKKRLKLLNTLQDSELLNERQRDWLRQELRKMAPGVAGERDAAHYLDMSFSETKNHAVLHDLRLEAEGQFAQIDHLVVDRLLTFFLLETKTYNGNLYINEHGEFMVEYANERRYGIESPLEQSRRHETVLKKILDRLGITGRAGTKPNFVHVVLVHPKAIIHRPDAKVFDTSMVIKADQFASWHRTFVDKFTAGTVVAGLLNARTRSTVKEWGELLKKEHRPSNPLELPSFMKPTPRKTIATVADQPDSSTGDDSASPLRPPPEPHPATPTETAPVCAICGKKLSAKVVKFCTDMSTKFGGKLYCYDHQAEKKKKRA